MAAARLPRAEAAGEQPVRSSQRDRAKVVFHPVVRDRHVAIIDEVRQLTPAIEAVVDLPSLAFFLPGSARAAQLPLRPDERFHDYRVLANGLAAVLARCPADLVARELQASAQALRISAAAVQECTGKAVAVGSDAQRPRPRSGPGRRRGHADTRATALRCLQRCVAARRLHTATLQVTTVQ